MIMAQSYLVTDKRSLDTETLRYSVLPLLLHVLEMEHIPFGIQVTCPYHINRVVGRILLA